jgi:hypothetical protein
MILSEITQIYLSLSTSKRLECGGDIPTILRQIFLNLRNEDVATTICGLKLLKVLAMDHPNHFVPELSVLFPRIQVKLFTSTEFIVKYLCLNVPL